MPEGTAADMDRAVAAAREAFDNGPWPRMAPADRAEAVGRLADLYAGRLGEIAELITEEGLMSYLEYKSIARPAS